MSAAKLGSADSPLAAGLVLVALAALIRGSRQPKASARRREVFLLTGGALAILLGSVATSDAVLRYVISVLPLVVTGGALALAELWPRARAGAGRSVPAAV